MGQMAWLAYLVDKQDKKELTKFLAGKGFKDPEFAAKEFLKAGDDLKKDKESEEIKDDVSSDEDLYKGNMKEIPIFRFIRKSFSVFL